MTRRITKPLPGYETPKVIPADLYDALELSALAFGGIGASKWFEWKAEPGEYPDPYEFDTNCPVCINGHAGFVCDMEGVVPISDALQRAGITTVFNDFLVPGINAALGRGNLNERVTFKQYVTAGNIKRGDA